VSIAAGLVPCAPGFAQEPDPPTLRDYCIKVAPGKAAEYEAFLHDAVVPLARARVESGESAWFIAEAAVSPAGTSAACDYRLVYGYKGLPPEALSKEALAAALKLAKLNLTVDDFIARRTALTQLVGVDIWWFIDGIGSKNEKGNYVRINHYNVKYGQMAEWTKLETTYWKAVVEAWQKAGGKGGWVVNGLMMPGGDRVPYNAATVDFFPDWNALMQGVPVEQLWPKVHPTTPVNDLFDRLEKVRSIHDIEVYKILELVQP
jgi:hypothetical protein